MLLEDITMYQEQRLEQILKLLSDKNELSSQSMMKYFDVSRDTIRRDFELLSKQGKVKRIHGGIMKLKPEDEIVSFDKRLHEFTAEKLKIAELALKFIKKNQTDFLDVSTITLKLAQMLDQQLTVYSHSLDNAIMFSNKTNVDFHLMGGKFYSKNRFYYSLEETEMLKNISFDVAFIGAAGLANGDVSFDDEADAHLKKLVLKKAKTKVLLAESSKLEKQATYSAGKIANFDYLITDKYVSIPEIDESKIIY